MPLTPSPAETSPAAARALFRAGLDAPTAPWAPGALRAHLVAVPASWAEDLSLFCARNPQACPVLDVCDGGVWSTPLASGADLRTDLPRYRVWEDGRLVAEPVRVTDWWHEELVGFLLGGRLAVGAALAAAGVPLRHLRQGQVLPRYVTHRPCRPAGRLSGPLVVAHRPVPAALLGRARAACAGGGPGAPGTPVHAGDPRVLGIRAHAPADFGGRVRAEPGDVPVFWACPVTAQAALRSARAPFAITSAPGHLLITDLPGLGPTRTQAPSALPGAHAPGAPIAGPPRLQSPGGP